MKVGYVCTNYNNSQFTLDAVASFSGNGSRGDPIVVVDNNSRAEQTSALERIENDFRDVTVIFGKENIGYFPGLNVGIRHLRRIHPEIEYIVIGNNDLIFPSDFNAKLRACRTVLDEQLVISPDVVTRDGEHQNPHVVDSISAFREFAYDVYHSNYYAAAAISWIAKVTRNFSDRRDELQWESSGPIHQGYGACYILGPKFFRNFDELWAPSFLMGEELFFARQLHSKGFRVFYEPRIQVTHHCHAATSQIPNRKRWQIARDAHRLSRKYVTYSER